MNAIVPANMGQVASVFANQQPSASDLSAGVQGGFGHIGYKGKVWSVRYQGNEVQLMRDDGDGPRNSIELVILKGATAVSKIYYENSFTEGAHLSPDCFSTNGVTPDPGAQKKQSATCASCPKNAWGSKVTPEGKQTKACGDSRRLAVVPLQDIRNEVYGGPMLLRVPASSLKELALFATKMAALGYPYNSIGVRVAFDPSSAFPKFQFSAIRALTNSEAELVVAMANSPEVARILAENEAGQVAQAPHQMAVAAAFEQPPLQIAAPVPAPAPVAPVTQQVTGFGPTTAPQPVAPQPVNNVVPLQQPVQAPQPAPAPVPVAAAPAAPVVGGDDFTKALDAQLADILPPA